MSKTQRPWLQLPRALIAGFALVLGLQIFTHQQVVSEALSEYRALSKPFNEEIYNGLSAGSQLLLSYLLVIRLQLHDNQAGRHIRYSLIDYDRLLEWFDRISKMNPASEYPMFLASRVYSQTANKTQIRKLLKYIDSNFKRNPQLFWRNQAEATVIAKHKLGDPELALQMAARLYEQPETIKMPQWARDMHFLLLADLNEFESSIAVVEALLGSNSITDPDEIRFLREKLLYFQQKLSEYQQKSD